MSAESKLIKVAGEKKIHVHMYTGLDMHPKRTYVHDQMWTG